MINWKEKLSSRKFWAAVVGFVTSVLTALGASELTVEQVSVIMGAVGTLVAYIISEGYVDGQRIKGDKDIEGQGHS